MAFLERVARQLAEKLPPAEWAFLVLVLPSRRAERFLRLALSEQLQHPTLAPMTITLDRLLGSMAGLRPLSSLDLVLRLYPIYQSLTQTHADAFETFVQWAPAVLRDFNELDRQGANSAEIWNHVLALEELSGWALSEEGFVSKRTQLVRLLPDLHAAFSRALLADGEGSSGLILRTASPAPEGPSLLQIQSIAEKLSATRFAFIGFNALTPCEESLVLAFHRHGMAMAFWDSDVYYMDDPEHEAGLYLRKFKEKWPTDLVADLHTPDARLATTERTIEVCGVAKQVGLAKATGDWIKNRLEGGEKEGDTPSEPKTLNRTAIVLADETLLIPILEALPDVKANVTMGVPLVSTPLYSLVDLLLEIQQTATPEGFSHRLVEEFLSHRVGIGLLGKNGGKAARKTLKTIQQQNASRLSPSWLVAEEQLGKTTGNALLARASHPNDWLELVAECITSWAESRTTQNQWEPTGAHLLARALHTLVEKSRLSVEPFTFKTVRLLLAPYVREEPIALFGEPFEGLQIMGMLESRLLDFDAVVVVGVNEGILPPGRSEQSFLPLTVRAEHHLPLPSEKEAIMAYHFYRLLQNPADILLMYNTEPDFLGSGEVSRYVHQLRAFFRFPSVTWKETVRYLPLSTAALSPTDSPWVLSSDEKQSVEQALTERGLSPSRLSLFLSDPEAFYRLFIVGIRENDSVSPVLQPSQYGSALHWVHEKAYKRYQQTPLPATMDISPAELSHWLEEGLREKYSGGQWKTGKNRLAYQVGFDLLTAHFKAEKLRMENREDRSYPWSVEAVEETLEWVLKTPHGPAKIKGIVDRVERWADGWVVIDLKTGGVDPKHLKITSFGSLFDPKKGQKPLQLLTYAWLVYKINPSAAPLRAGIAALQTPRSAPHYLHVEGESLLSGALLDAFEKEVLMPLVDAIRGATPWPLND